MRIIRPSSLREPGQSYHSTPVIEVITGIVLSPCENRCLGIWQSRNLYDFEYADDAMHLRESLSKLQARNDKVGTLVYDN